MELPLSPIRAMARDKNELIIIVTPNVIKSPEYYRQKDEQSLVRIYGYWKIYFREG